MSVIFFEKHWNGSTGSYSSGSRKYSAIYRLKTDDPLDNAKVIFDYILDSGGGNHAIGEAYEYGNDTDSTSFLRSIEPTRSPNSATHWDVVLNYEPSTTEDKQDQNSDGSGNPSTSPDQWYDRFTIDGFTITTPVETAVYHDGFKGQAARARQIGSIGPVHNSAFMPFSPGLERETEAKIIRRTWYSNTYADLAAMERFEGFVNASPYTINRPDLNFVRLYFAHTVKVKKTGSALEIVNNGLWWHHSIELWVNPFGWRVQIVDRGRYARAWPGDPDGNGGTISDSDVKRGQAPVREITEINGDPIEDDVLLDGDGQPLRAGAKPVYLTYQKTPEIDFPDILMRNQ